MSDDWRNYFVRTETSAKSIIFDMGVADVIDRSELSSSLKIQVMLKNNTDTGFASPEEYAVLAKLEKQIEAQVKGANCLYLGRIQGAGENNNVWSCWGKSRRPH